MRMRRAAGTAGTRGMTCLCFRHGGDNIAGKSSSGAIVAYRTRSVMLLMMPTEFQQHCQSIEEYYEFALSYAAQGHGTDKASAQGRQLRDALTRAVEAMRGLEQGCAALMESGQFKPAERYESFFSVLTRDARDAASSAELVLAQDDISSQLIDNLNASIHVRALLTDIFLVEEILETHQSRATAEKHEVD